jgi:chromosomal replication initiator protein
VLVDQVCRKHKVTKRDIESDCRELRCVNPRREISYRARHELSMSLSDIGTRMGGRDHTTILNNIRNWERLVKIKNGNGEFDHLKKNNDDKFDWGLIE